MTKMVCGFLFSLDGNYVLLIKKKKPEWQKGYLNGLGGKMERGEAPADAMFREFHEESGLRIDGWELFLNLHVAKPKIKVFFFRAFAPEKRIKRLDQQKMAEGELICHPMHCLSLAHAIPNLRWLLPLALDDRLRDGVGYDFPVTVKEKLT